MRETPPDSAPRGFTSRLLTALFDEVLCVSAGLAALGGTAWLCHRPPESPLLAGVLGFGLVWVVVGAYTASRYAEHRVVELQILFGEGERLRNLFRVGCEVQKLTLVELATLVAEAAKVVAALACFACFLAPEGWMAAAGFVSCVYLALLCDSFAGHLRSKLDRFFHWDGVMVVSPVAESPGAGRPGAGVPRGRRSLAVRLDAALDAFLYPPITVDEVELLELLAAETRVDPEQPCRVCGEGLGREAPLVACRGCQTPHHRDCFEYLGQCSVYACGCTGSEPVSVAGGGSAADEPAPGQAAGGTPPEPRQDP